MRSPQKQNADLSGLRTRRVDGVDLSGLRVHLVTSAASLEQRAYVKLKRLLSEHGQHLSEKTRSLFGKTLTGLLLHGLRAREVEPAQSSRAESTPDETWIRFKGSDGRSYQAHPEEWPEVQKRDPEARRIQTKKPLHDRLFGM
jgi:hypothetical protein